ncbi:MAG: hypothetical protein IJL78_05395 [Lachnospiraceae bacterium]|nr:hypothetical protein [Lachnospiraceae bacterium]
MKIRYLGTAAAEGIPAMFCHCENCEKARRAGGKNIRTRSQTLIDGKLNVDFSPDSYMHELCYGLNYADVRYYLFTHVHEDHFYPLDFNYMYHGLGHVPEGHPGYDVYGSEDILPGLQSLEHSGDMDYLRLHPLAPFKTAEIGDYRVTPIRANHGTPHPYCYIISDGKKTILYLHDTGLLPEDSLSCITGSGLHFDLVSYDCTGGNHERLSYTSHLCFADIRRYTEEFRALGLIDGRTVLVLNHFSHNSPAVNYDDRGVYEALGYVMAYDGLEIEV